VPHRPSQLYQLAAPNAAPNMPRQMVRRPIQDTPVWQAYNRKRYAILFYSLLLTMIAMPVVTTFGLPAVLIRLLLAASLFAAVMPNATRRTRVTLFVVVLFLVALRWLADYDLIPLNPGLMPALIGLVGLIAAAGALSFLVNSRDVDSETLHAALGTYLLAGVFFGQIYWALESAWPGSIVGPDPVTQLSAIYYSFVTLATLGYGDFLPRTDIARGVATFEVIGGQLFLAVMVARLIGLFASERERS